MTTNGSFNVLEHLRTAADQSRLAYNDLQYAAAMLSKYGISIFGIEYNMTRKPIQLWEDAKRLAQEHVGNKAIRDACKALAKERYFKEWHPEADKMAGSEMADVVGWTEADVEEMLGELRTQKDRELEEEMENYRSSDERGHGKDG